MACLKGYILVLSHLYHVYESKIEKTVEGQLEFNLIDELFDKEITQISGSYEHAFAVAKDGRVFGRGSNNFGQLAVGKGVEFAEKFTEITSLSKFQVKNVSAGVSHSLFLTSEGKVLACGNNFIGQLPLASGMKKKIVFTPVETVFNEDVTFCVAGAGETAVFTNLPVPLNTPNIKVTKAHRRQSKIFKGKAKVKGENKADVDEQKSDTEPKKEVRTVVVDSKSDNEKDEVKKEEKSDTDTKSGKEEKSDSEKKSDKEEKSESGSKSYTDKKCSK